MDLPVATSNVNAHTGKPRRPRGHKRREDFEHVKALAYARNGHLKRAVPPATDAQWDSRQQGWVPPVKDQSQCGSCWDFSGTGVVEIALIKAGILKGDGSQALSEEYVLSCLKNGGCNGDDNTTVLDAAKANGLPFTSDYGPYDAGNGRPGACKFKSSMKMSKIDDWGFADGGQGDGVTATQDIKNAIKYYGGIGAAIAADDAFEAWGDQSPSLSNPFQGSGSRSIDHDIILVGWDDKLGAWLLRNSWGTSWGVGGYMMIKYGANLVGTEAVWAVVNGTPIPPPGPTPGPIPPTPGPIPASYPTYTGTLTGTMKGALGASYPVSLTGTFTPNSQRRAGLDFDAVDWVKAIGDAASAARAAYARDIFGVIRALVALASDFGLDASVHPSHAALAAAPNWAALIGDALALFIAAMSKDPVAVMAALTKLAADLGLVLTPAPAPMAA